jgi:hypothetical protein
VPGLDEQVLTEVDAAAAVRFEVGSTRQGAVDRLDQPTDGFEQVPGSPGRQSGNHSRRAPERMPSKPSPVRITNLWDGR